MLSLHKIDLTSKDKAYLTKQFQNGDQLKYKEALERLTIDLDFASMDEKKWTVQRPEDAKKLDQTDAMSRVTSKALSKLQADVKSTTLS